MRFSVPGIPSAILSTKSTAPPVSIQEAIERLTAFVKDGNVTVITGAGVSVDSGIRAYRGKDGRYMNPNYKPILYHEYTDDGKLGNIFRKRYWLRSYLGYPHVRDTKPNTTHCALAALQYSGHIQHIITQNVDGLHHKALALGGWSSSAIANKVLELHGSIHRVVCRRGHVIDRETFQDWLTTANPKWKAFADEIARTGTILRTNPDGDVDVEHLGLPYESFIVPECPHCISNNHTDTMLKPEFIFFGESIPEKTKVTSYEYIDKVDKILLMGTTLATHSSFRLVKHADSVKKPILLVNVGPTRADPLPDVFKIELPTGSIIQDVARMAIGSRIHKDPMIEILLGSGIVKPPLSDSQIKS
ncbi:hypothetical protein AMATHDRAFT_39891 [Amanita thiersii Skay4041]|uniref:Deacetylase sirtuin-type domain-containing protein n=1 Tax=Amanita thiersii Skay4041 TaxID=703135 RepID=A0A2A9NVR8_9AGAR|nr:hypothetical protein AMATHDRAFT_39891 [Amanita thiersii Skay4041]